jgi:hypothetical protein
MYVRWQHRVTSTRQGPLGLTTTPGLPTAGDLALEAAAVAVSRSGPWRRSLPRSKRPKPAALVAIVVESQRMGGQPRQRLVQYVGSIRIDDVDLPSARRKFWDRAAVRLAQFTPEARKRLEDAIAAKIPRPLAEEPGLSLAQKLAAAEQRMLAARTTKELTTT